MGLKLRSGKDVKGVEVGDQGWFRGVVGVRAAKPETKRGMCWGLGLVARFAFDMICATTLEQPCTESDAIGGGHRELHVRMTDTADGAAHPLALGVEERREELRPVEAQANVGRQERTAHVAVEEDKVGKVVRVDAVVGEKLLVDAHFGADAVLRLDDDARERRLLGQGERAFSVNNKHGQGARGVIVDASGATFGKLSHLEEVEEIFANLLVVVFKIVVHDKGLQST